MQCLAGTSTVPTTIIADGGPNGSKIVDGGHPASISRYSFVKLEVLLYALIRIGSTARTDELSGATGFMVRHSRTRSDSLAAALFR